jgi:spore maturation protein CgeB
MGYVTELPEEERQAIGARARRRVLAEHTAGHRAAALERYLAELADAKKVAA